MSMPLLSTKLFIPPRRPNLVVRPRLILKLEDSLRKQSRLHLVSAKAGSGKTTLVSEWVRQQDRPAAWLSLDANDDDPRRFINYLIAALQGLDIKFSPAVLSHLQAPQLPQVEAFVGDLINDVTAQAISMLLVLDDYHLIQNEWIHQAVAFLVEHQPPELQLILVTRVDPPLPLARLRGRGLISEIRGADLRFTAQETAQFFNEVMALNLSEGSIAALEGRTEGWIVGLQMAAVSMQGHKQKGDQTAFIDSFRGTNRFVLDYLMEEVLSQQSPVAQDFLLETSILARMCGALCDAVISNEPNLANGGAALSPPGSSSAFSTREAYNSQAILAQLERANLFVVSLDNERRWYRYHHLFSDLLQSILSQRRTAAEIRQLHRRVGRWHYEQGHLEEAMIHAMAAQDFEHAASMIDENIASMLSRSEAPLLLGWIEKLPREIALSRPWIDVYRGYTLALSGRPDEAGQVLKDVEQRIDPNYPRYSEIIGQIAAIRCFTASLQGDAARVIEMAYLAERHLPEEHLNARGIVAYALSDVYFARDDMAGAGQSLSKMFEVGEKLDRLLMVVPALCDQAGVKKVQGRLHQAEDLYGRAWGWMVKRNGQDSRVRCPYEIGLADLHREWNQLDAAHEYATTGILYCQRFAVPSLLVSGFVGLMQILQAQGDMDGALAMLHKAEQRSQANPIRLTTRIEFNTARVLFWLAAGDVRAARRWAKACAGGSELEQIVLARLLLGEGRAEAAQELLDRQCALAESGGRSGRLIEILSLKAVALKEQDRLEEAGEALSQALSLARPEGYRRLFLDLGRPMQELLQRSAALESTLPKQQMGGAVSAGAYEREILDAFELEQGLEKRGRWDLPSVPADFAAASLTERELEVLKLLAKGISNKEIAAQLVVAPSTVKQHLKNIYSKLEVHSRIQAVERGRERNLI